MVVLLIISIAVVGGLLWQKKQNGKKIPKAHIELIETDIATPQSTELKITELEIVEQIGSGEFSNVFKGNVTLNFCHCCNSNCLGKYDLCRLNKALVF